MWPAPRRDGSGRSGGRRGSSSPVDLHARPGSRPTPDRAPQHPSVRPHAADLESFLSLGPNDATQPTKEDAMTLRRTAVATTMSIVLFTSVAALAVAGPPAGSPAGGCGQGPPTGVGGGPPGGQYGGPPGGQYGGPPRPAPTQPTAPPAGPPGNQYGNGNPNPGPPNGCPPGGGGQYGGQYGK